MSVETAARPNETQISAWFVAVNVQICVQDPPTSSDTVIVREPLLLIATKSQAPAVGVREYVPLDAPVTLCRPLSEMYAGSGMYHTGGL
jgi:hypothetical protein